MLVPFIENFHIDELFIVALCIAIFFIGSKVLITGKGMTRNGYLIQGLPARLLGLGLILFGAMIAGTFLGLIDINGAICFALMITNGALWVSAMVIIYFQENQRQQ